jgi:DNA-binding Xre family transcriptional regulator
MKVVWHLNLIMARWHISNKDLAQELGRHPTSISRLRTATVMPRLGGEELQALCNALGRLSGHDIGPADLLQE